MKKTVFEINGEQYELRFDMYAMELIEDEIGSIGQMFNRIQSGKGMVKAVSMLFVAMANSARSYNGQPENVTADVVRRMSPARVKELQAVIMQAVNESMRTESDDREAGDDEYLAEARKNGEGGEKAAN